MAQQLTLLPHSKTLLGLDPGSPFCVQFACVSPMLAFSRSSSFSPSLKHIWSNAAYQGSEHSCKSDWAQRVSLNNKTSKIFFCSSLKTSLSTSPRLLFLFPSPSLSTQLPSFSLSLPFILWHQTQSHESQLKYSWSNINLMLREKAPTCWYQVHKVRRGKKQALKWLGGSGVFFLMTDVPRWMWPPGHLQASQTI